MAYSKRDLEARLAKMIEESGGRRDSLITSSTIINEVRAAQKHNAKLAKQREESEKASIKPKEVKKEQAKKNKTISKVTKKTEKKPAIKVEEKPKRKMNVVKGDLKTLHIPKDKYKKAADGKEKEGTSMLNTPIVQSLKIGKLGNKGAVYRLAKEKIMKDEEKYKNKRKGKLVDILRRIAQAPNNQPILPAKKRKGS